MVRFHWLMQATSHLPGRKYWVLNTGKVIHTNSSGGDMIMTFNQTGGTRLSSTRYVHYGKIIARSESPPTVSGQRR
ncbi:hypothetical protein C0992_004090 [Termitomyces sp. T32_za158]|nr:hypothetical protein C0992_004090 [Termitomyces sp. T32_za158]